MKKMINNLKVSVIIINYNYGKYIKDAINSLLNQTYFNIEIIVVDDGSTDDSRRIIDSYGNKIQKKIYQKNSGMTEAANQGFKITTGEIIIFLDADDYLFNNALEKIVERWDVGVSKIHYRLKKVNDNGSGIGFAPKLSLKLDEGDVWKKILTSGDYSNVPTSGNAFCKNVLENFFPILDSKIGDGNSYFDKIPLDAYLKMRIPFFGKVIAIQDSLAVYRVHGKNNGATTSPYFNRKKRQRVLKLAYLNSIFLQNASCLKGFSWHNDILFKKNKMMTVRILSYRFDGNSHLWKEDNKKVFLLKLFKSLFQATNYNKIRKVYNLTLNIMFLFLKKEWVIFLLRTVHPNSYSKQ